MEQHMEALALANTVRLEGARLRREIKERGFREGLRRCADLLEDPPEFLFSMRLGHLLAAVDGLGIRKIDGLLRGVGVRSTVVEWRVRHLSETQRRWLARALRDKAAKCE